MQRKSDAEQCFLQDVREKKQAATGVHSKKGKRGYVGKMLFPTDFMTRKEKYNYRKGGKIVSSNMYDIILPIKEFEALEPFEKKNRMQYWRSNNSIKTIQKEMQIPNAKFYAIVKELGLPTLDRSPRNKRAAKTIAVKVEKKAAPIIVQEKMNSTFNLSFNGTFPGDDILKQLTKFISLLEGEKDHYYVNFNLQQKERP